MSAWTQRRRREQAKASGLCIQCCAVPHMPERTRCPGCAKDNAVRNRGRVRPSRAKGCRSFQYEDFCLECIASGGYHRVGCIALSKEAA